MSPIATTQRTSLVRARKWCFCVDFRVGTMVLAMFQIVVHLACMGFLMVLVIRPNLVHELMGRLHSMNHYEDGAHAGVPEGNPLAPVSGPPFSLPQTFHMMIFGREQTLITKDKDGKAHMTHIYEIGQPLLIAVKPPTKAIDDQSKSRIESVGSIFRPDLIQAAKKEGAPEPVIEALPNPNVLIQSAQNSEADKNPSVSQDSLPRLRKHISAQDEHPEIGEQHGYYSQIGCQRKRHHMLALICLWVSLCFACCLLYGSTMRRPVFILPYLGVQVACFLFYLVGLAHSFSYFPHLRSWIEHKPNMPFKDYFLQMSEFQLTLIFTSASMSILLVKLNLLALVWGCYHTLSVEQRQARIIQRQQGQLQTASAENGVSAVSVVIDVPPFIILEGEEKNGEIYNDVEKEQPPSYFYKPEEGQAVKEEKEDDDVPLLA